MGLLTGITIIEWGEAITAPFCGKVLADLGATVIKLESLPQGDPGRGLPPFAGERPGRDRSLLFAHLNARKQGVAIDMTTNAGLEIFEALLGEADVLIEDRTPEERAAAGIAYDDVHAKFPTLVVTSLTPYGCTGPYKDRRGEPSVSSHMSGAAYATPSEVASVEQPPLSLAGRPAAMTGGLCGAAATLLALLSRSFDQQGRHADVAEVETMLPVMASPLNLLAFDGSVQPREDRGHGLAPFDFYPVKDGYASVFLVQEAHWQRLLELMGNPEWADVPMFADRRIRAQYREDLSNLLQPWFEEQRNEDLYQRAQAMDLPIGPVRGMAEVLADDQSAFREVFQRGHHPSFGDMLYIQPPYRSTAVPWQTPAPAPSLGQHTNDILQGWLGVSKREVASLAAAGVI